MVSSKKNRTATEKRMMAMSHPMRSAIYGYIAERPASPAQMAEPLKESVPNVSYHCKKLVELGCAEMVDTRSVRGATEHFYRALDRHVVDTEEWKALLEKDPTAARHLIGEFMQPIVDDLSEAARNGAIKDENFHITRTPIVLDPEGIAEGLEIFEAAREAMIEVQERVAERRGKTVSFSSSLALFQVR